MHPSGRPVLLKRFFSGLAEFAFETRLGLADPPLIEYIADLLTRFVRLEAIYSIRSLSGQPLEEVAEMLVEAQYRIGDARREVHRHIGDFALFWTGIYPEALQRMTRGTRDFFLDYCTEGKRAYYIASTIRTQENAVQSQVLVRLSHEFELCTYGLGEIRREWERRDADGGDTPRPLLFD